MKRSVGFVVYPGFQMLDLSGPAAALETGGRWDSSCDYEVSLLSPNGGMVKSSGGIQVETLKIAQAPALHTVIACGGVGALHCNEDAKIIRFLRDHHQAGTRMASVCTGAFLLAAAGLLKGCRATTHWRYAAQFQRTYPDVLLQSDSIWVQDQGIWTSAGVTAGIDLTLALIAQDNDEDTSRLIARELVVYHRRPGGQTQFSAMLDLVSPTGKFAGLLDWARLHLDQTLSVDELADHVAMSPRHFSRAFTEETGQTPAKAVEQLRLEVARELIEGKAGSVESVARQVGFRSADRMRRAFVRSFGVPPKSIRQTS
jgi:transcriptional regulator GlxA family with amidase domain